MGIRPVGSPFSSYNPEEPESSLGVLQVQKALNQLGGESLLPENGIFTPETQSAVSNFQKQNGLKVTGDIDPTTVNVMQIALRNQDAQSPAVNASAHSTGKEDLSLAGVLMKTQFSGPFAGTAPTLRPMMDSLRLTLTDLAPTIGLTTDANMPPVTSRDGFVGFASDIARAWGGAALERVTSDFKSSGVLNPEAQNFASVLSSIQCDPQKLNPQNWIPFAQAGAEYALTMLEFSSGASMTNLVSPFQNLGGQQLGNADFLASNGEQLAQVLTALASGSSPGAAGLPVLSGTALSLGSIAAGFNPGIDGMMIPMLASSLQCLFGQLPQMLGRCGLSMEGMMQANTVPFQLLSMTITSVIISVVSATQRQVIVKTDRQIASIVDSTVRSQVAVSSAIVSDALQKVLRHCEVNTQRVLSAAIESMMSSNPVESTQGFGEPVAGVGPKDVAFILQNSAQRVMDMSGRIIEESRSLLLLSGN